MLRSAGSELPLQLGNARQNMIGDDGGIGALAFGNGNGDGGEVGTRPERADRSAALRVPMPKFT